MVGVKEPKGPKAKRLRPPYGRRPPGTRQGLKRNFDLSWEKLSKGVVRQCLGAMARVPASPGRDCQHGTERMECWVDGGDGWGVWGLGGVPLALRREPNRDFRTFSFLKTCRPYNNCKRLQKKCKTFRERSHPCRIKIKSDVINHNGVSNTSSDALKWGWPIDGH
jgi:hypothetical protein